MAKFSLLFLTISAAIICKITAAPNISRIIGGSDAQIGQFPYQVSLQNEDGAHGCGGSILNERYILTAAHCVVVGDGIEAYPAKYFQVRVGSIQLSMGGKLLKIKRITVNKAYSNLLNDLALLELEQPLKWTDNIQPIELATDEVPSGEEVLISGWGFLYHSGLVPNRLQWITVKALTREQCKQAIYWDEDSLLCLAHEVDKGACNGDSGGPATYKGKLVGVAGFIFNSCGSVNPDGYAKIAYHRDWILENIKS